MDEIGLFPLGMVLLPTETVPLHIFEPRYRQLIGECLETGAPFGLIYAREDGLAAIGTLAHVSEVLERFGDGRLNILVTGGARFRLVELTDGQAFHTGEVENLEDVDDPGDGALAERAIELFQRLVELTGGEIEGAGPDPSSAQLSFELAARFDLAPDLKQELLEEVSERIRLRRLCELLAAAAVSVEHQREVAARAQTNGKVDPHG